MKASVLKFFIALLIFPFAFVSTSLTVTEDSREERITAAFHDYLDRHSLEMLDALRAFKEEVNSFSGLDSGGLAIVRKKFSELRSTYKLIEPFSCYYFNASERNFNGPVVPEIEDEDDEKPKVEWPHGLQQMEAYLWDKEPVLNKSKLIDEINLMEDNLSALNIAFKTVPTDEARFIESMQFQVLRTFMLGMAGFDTPESGNAVGEATISLLALHEALIQAYKEDSRNEYARNVLSKLDDAVLFFSLNTSLNDIDFLSLYRDHYVRISKAFAEMRTNFVEKNHYPASALRMQAPSVFQADAFNLFFYNPRGTDPAFSSEAAALGKALFFDPALSENNKRACASCHRPEKAFTDGMKTSPGFLEGEMLTRNTPTLINAALQRNYFYDMRADHLEGQIGHVLTNKSEMQSSFESAVKKLSASPQYVEWFRKAFRGKEDTVISKTSIENAISEYERTLIALNSKFDRNIRGEEITFTQEERTGFNLFMNKAKCGTCHYLPLLSNVVPPQYTLSEFEIIGTTRTADLEKPELDPDKGRGGIYGTQLFMHAFKTPTLRNIALTGPYMHNGAFQTLEQVVEFYNRGGGAGLGLSVPNQTLPATGLQLSPAEKKAMVAFLHTLTDTSNTTSKPSKLPSLKNALLDKRKPGGEY
jgi:cytochrome c peroxidase